MKSCVNVARIIIEAFTALEIFLVLFSSEKSTRKYSNYGTGSTRLGTIKE